ncbi:MAG: hypothetical protein LBV29_03055 [Azoarcus sp.]|jgi:hypothetical protein|nr:hypothetical protein [Azoarcus sp.]
MTDTITLPPLPSPDCMGLFTHDQMRAYGELCAKQALEDTQAADNIDLLKRIDTVLEDVSYAGDYVEGIRVLKNLVTTLRRELKTERRNKHADQ